MITVVPIGGCGVKVHLFVLAKVGLHSLKIRSIRSLYHTRQCWWLSPKVVLCLHGMTITGSQQANISLHD